MTNKSKKISFSIEHIDPLGQGVSKLNDQITFIPKTLPGEEGTAVIYKQSKGVSFATVNENNISKKSNKRIDPACPHYTLCQGCHFLHCSHESELNFKKESLTRMFQRLNVQVPPEIITLNQRFSYRNRIQLHYDVRKKQIGFINKYTNQIHSVNQCLLPKNEIKIFLENWYKTQQWYALAKKQKPKGHVELLLLDGEVQVHWNKRYSSGGFTQVNQEMNEVMLELVHNIGTQKKPKQIVDLYAGNGNLTNRIKSSTDAERIALDLYPHGNNSDEFITADLDALDSLDFFKQKNKIQTTDLLVVDPPRKGFKNIAAWCNYLNPSDIIYVSCNPATLVRDIQELSNYQVENIFLLDMFPSTYHFETVVVLKKF